MNCLPNEMEYTPEMGCIKQRMPTRSLLEFAKMLEYFMEWSLIQMLWFRRLKPDFGLGFRLKTRCFTIFILRSGSVIPPCVVVVGDQ